MSASNAGAAASRDVGLGMQLDSDETGGVFIEQLVPGSIAEKSGQVLLPHTHVPARQPQ